MPKPFEPAMKAKIIRDEETYGKALAVVETLMDAAPGSPQEEELELWSLLIEEYEKKQHPIEDPDPIEAIRFRMDQLGLQRKDLEGVIGAKSKVSEVMNRKRPLSLSMIRSLHEYLNIPASVLVRESPHIVIKKPTTAGRFQKQTTSKVRVRKAPIRKQKTEFA
jgi:HTH-type transcriptional regulator/antitoxin HigA